MNSQFEETPTRRIKGRFDELSKTRKIRESIVNNEFQNFFDRHFETLSS